MRSGRPPGKRAAPLLAACAALLTFAVIAPAAGADTFKRDRTPLPASLTGGGSQAATTHATSGGSSYLRLVIGLAIVIALVFGIRKLLKRTQKGRTHSATAHLAVVATTPLAQNRAVHLVRVGDELVLVGSAEQGVTPLRVYTPSEARTLEQTLDASAPFTETSGGAGIGSFLHDLRKRTAR